MAVTAKPPIIDEIIYPESDGKPMAENTEQYDWMVMIKENLDGLLENAFVAADLFWYPVQGSPKTVQAPDVMVALGRPKGRRGSYKQWEEANVAPQVVFEILSPGNRIIEMYRKQKFYQHYGVQEYYLYDPDEKELVGYLSKDGAFQMIDDISNWISPLLGIRFELRPGEELKIYSPDGKQFLTVAELRAERDRERQRAEQERQHAEQERQRADEAQLRADEAQLRAQKLAEKLRALGIDPDAS
jgi:Uma2 family endonuclease